MATVILIVFLALVVILGGWWLKRERVNQKNELVNQGKLAAGKFDQVVLPAKKPKKRKRKKREANWWDPKYTPPEIPSKSALEAWVAQAATVVDELMPGVMAYRTGVAKNEAAKRELAAAQSRLVKQYPAAATTDNQSQDWYLMLEEHLQAYHDAKAAAEAVAGELRALLLQVKNPALDLRSLKMQAEAWELYRAPDPFHEKLEIVTLLCTQLEEELDFNSLHQVHSSEDRWSKEDFSRRRKRAGKDGFGWGADTLDVPEEKPVPNTEIVGQTRLVLQNVLPHVAVLAATAETAFAAYNSWQAATKHVPLTRPTKPVNEEVDALLATAFAWAQTQQSAKLQAYQCGVKAKQCLDGMKSALSPLKTAVESLQSACIPEQDRIVQEAISSASSQLDAFVRSLGDSLKAVIAMRQPYSTETESQSARDSAAGLRNLMRKAAFELGQSESAKAAHEAAKGERVQLAETVPPVLTQSSAAAFINAHIRMSEINARNSQKSEAQRAKVRQLEAQFGERERQAIQSVRAVSAAANTIGAKRQDWSANLDLMYSAATLFGAAFNK
jgi:hypothetical protein